MVDGCPVDFPRATRALEAPKRTKIVARKKKPVDRTPICDPAYLRRIDPIWMPGPVPRHFWEVKRHRRDYLLWLAQRLGVRTMGDFYQLRLEAFYEQNFGGGVNHYWRQSPLKAVQDCFPEYDWKAWLFGTVPEGFWDSRANRRSYMNWLGQRLGYRCMDDWYEISSLDFQRNKGGGLLQCYDNSPAQAVADFVARRNWCPWKFHRVPSRFWEAAENRHRYLTWLGKELGFRRPEDWYQISTREIARRQGKPLLNRYSSFYDLMREFLPQLDWDRVDMHRPIRVEETPGVGRRAPRQARDMA